MVVSLSFSASDYQKLSEIQCLNCDNLAFNELLSRNVDVKKEILQVFLGKFEKNGKTDPDKVFVGRGKERENANISLTQNDENKNDENREKVERLNGIIGALSGAVSVSEILEDTKSSERTKNLLQEFEDSSLHINLQIKSRFDQENKSFFVAYLLTCNQMKLNNYFVYEKTDDIFDFLLIDMLNNKLLNALPKGLFRTYHRSERNDSRVNGAINVARHIRLNMGQNNGRVAYDVRENSVINSLNELIVVAYEYIRQKYPDFVFLKVDSKVVTMIHELKMYLGGKTNSISQVIAKNIRPIAHPFFQEYEEVRKICLQIFWDQGVSIFDSMDGDVSGFLYYVPDLWEDFLDDMFQKYIDNGKRLCYEAQMKVNEYFPVRVNGKYKFEKECRPDFVFQEKDGEGREHPYFVLDAKYKPRWATQAKERKFKIGKLQDEEIAADIAECMTYLSVTDASCFCIACPINEPAFSYKNYNPEKAICRINHCDTFFLLPFRIPEVKEGMEYRKWVEQLEESKKMYMKILVSDVLKYVYGNEDFGDACMK